MTSTTKATVLTVAALLLLAGCGGTGNDGSSTSSLSADRAGAGTAAAPAAKEQAPGRADSAVLHRDVIATGTLAIAARDLASPRARVDAVLAAHDGVVADESSSSDKGGRTEHTRLVVRVPSGQFDAVMSALGRVPGVRDSSRQASDVTTQVIDTAQRVKAQRAGLDSVEALLGRAGSLTDVLKLEQEITRRQADLDSLLQQQAALADQTSLSTVTITLDRTTAPAPPREHRPAGFVSGFAHGWHAFGLAVSGALTGLGAALPFLVLLGVVGVPASLLLRRRVAASSARTP